jgi:hypothetical protein
MTDWFITLLTPSTREGWALVALFGLPILGALLLVWAIFHGAGA